MANKHNKYKGHKECYVCGHCGYDCPNATAQAYLDRYDIDWSDIAWNLEKIDCKECYLHDWECISCLFQNSSNCPEYKEPDVIQIIKADDIKSNDEWMKEDIWDEYFEKALTEEIKK